MTTTDLSHVNLVNFAGDMINLGDLAFQFGAVNRLIYRPDGEWESDTDHTVMLGWLACAMAARFYPDLDVGLIAQYALVHDAPEVYAGDTPTLRITPEALDAKYQAEKEATQRLVYEFEDELPWFGATLTRYEAQDSREARFVRALDKCLPKVAHILTKARLVIDQKMGRQEFHRRICVKQHEDMAAYAGEFTVLMELHALLADEVHHLLPEGGEDADL